MNPLYKLALYALLVIGLLGGAWYALSVHDKAQQAIGANSVQVKWDAQVIVDRKAVADRTAVLQKEKDDAEIKAQVRIDAANRVAATAVASSKLLDGTLRTVIARSATDSVDANRKYTATLGTILGECENRYRAMGEAAQRHANDALKYQEAWPK